MQVKATKRGFDGVKVRELGETFNFEGKLGSWMEPVEEVAEQKKPVKETAKTEKQK